MKQADLEQEVSYYVADVHKYVNNQDWTSALIMSRGLTKLILDHKKSLSKKPLKGQLDLEEELNNGRT